MKVKLTQQKVKQLLAHVPAGDEDYWCTLLPGFGLRLRRKGARTYIVGGRFGNGSYRRLELGDARQMTFEAAKEKARAWLELGANGKDPRAVEAATVAVKAAEDAHTVAAVANQFMAEWVIGPNPKRPRQRRWFEVKRHVAIITDKWAARPIGDIERDEVVRLVKVKAKTAPAEARNLLGAAKQLWGWAREQDFGLRHNIAADIKPRMVVGDKVMRERALSIEEARALYAAAAAMPYPYGPAFQLLILSGLRLNECVAGRWREIDLKNKVWVIPSSRMKGREGRTRPFEVPLTGRMIATLESLPRFTSGDCLFSTTGGQKPIALGDKAKKALDDKLQFAEPWQIHDLRRTIRSAVVRPEFGVKEEVAEAILAHKPPGIRAVYNVHPYFDERRVALEQWGDAIDPPSNVTRLRQSHAAIS
jgi:integrase